MAGADGESSPHVAWLSDPLFGALADAADAAGLGVSIAVVDEPVRSVFVSDGLARLLGRTTEELRTIPVFALLPEDERQRLLPMLAARLKNDPTPLVYRTAAMRSDGQRVPVEVSTARAEVAGRPANVTFVRDLTRQNAEAAALEKAETLLRAMVVSAPDGVVILRGPYIVFANPTATRLLGYSKPEDVLGRSVVDLVHPDDARTAGERIGAMLRTGHGQGTPHPYRPIAESVLGTTVEISSTVITYEGAPAVLAFARDVTERKALEARLMRADRLTALGTLAAGVAHEINNPLAYVLLNLQYIERKLAEAGLPEALTTSIDKRIRDAISGAQRVGTIVRDLHAFAHPDEDSRGPVDVVEIIDSALRVAQHEVRHRAQVTRDLAALPMIDANAGRLEQLFLNLIVNAAHALDPSQLDRNRITITGATDGNDHLVVTIADNGQGIAPAVLERVFDPFFTTKPVGQGTGLGLPICQSIVTSLGGAITIESQVGIGTVVTVTLALHHPATLPPPPAEIPVNDAIQHTRGRLLIVDDEVIVADTLAQLLAERHTVEVAHSAARALELIAERAPYDAILCDLVMPAMTGMQLHARIAETNPQLAERMLFMTGGAFLPDAELFLRDGNHHAIQKPFDLEALTRLIDRAMARASAR